MLIFDTTRLIQAAITLFVMAIAIITYGNGAAFDACATFVVLGALVYFRKNIDVLSTLSIILFSRVLGILLFNVVDNLLIWKFLAYAATAFCLIKFKNDKLKGPIAALLIIALSAECYWWVTDYQSPQIFWSFILIACNIALRSILLTRPILMQTYLNIEGNITRLDWHLYKFFGWVIIAESIQVIEYLARHLTSYSGIYYYNAYTYIMHTLAAIYIIMVLNFCYQQHQLKTINA